MKRTIASLVFGALLAACVGTTGGADVDFPAAAAGPADAVAGQPLVFVNDKGWAVTLTKASLHVGAVYLDQSEPVSGAGDTQCVLPGIYAVQVTTGMDVDLLSPARQPFPAPGHGLTGPALTGQVWLTGGDIDAIDDATPILHVEGTARRGSDARAFAGTLTIGANRMAAAAVAGANPPCKQRIVTVPLARHVDVGATGGLLLRIDPRQLFLDLDFGYLAPAPAGGIYEFRDDSGDPASAVLYSNLRAAGLLYGFEWDGDL